MTDGARHITLPFSVPQDHPSFAGHFPGDPLVPGALLLRWMIEQLQQQQLAVYLIKQCKFLNIVRPGDQLQLQVTLNGRETRNEAGVSETRTQDGDVDPKTSLVVTISCGDTPIAKAQCLYRLQESAHE